MTASNLPPIHLTRPSIRSTLDRRFWLVATLGTIASFVLLGLVSAIIPNPVFTRTIPPDGAAIAVWIASAPLMGVLLATTLSSPRSASAAPGRDLTGSGLTLGSLATFFAIGCPVCNKIVLLALGTTCALNVFAPIQPIIGIASLALLAATVRWSLRRRAIGCAVAEART
jgi:hypothetical protein